MSWWSKLSKNVSIYSVDMHPCTATRHDTAQHNSVFTTPSPSPWPPNLPSSLFCSLLQMFILKIDFFLGLKRGLHLNFSFTKQKNILLEGNGIKEKWFSMCPEAWHRQDLICYVRLESGLIRRDERGCLIKFTFHFLTWHHSPVTHGTDGNAANNFCQNLVGETDWEMKRQKREREKRTIWLVFTLRFQCWKKTHCGWMTWDLPASTLEGACAQVGNLGRHLGTDAIQLPSGGDCAVQGESMDWRRSFSFYGTGSNSCQLKKRPEAIQRQEQRQKEMTELPHIFFSVKP